MVEYPTIRSCECDLYPRPLILRFNKVVEMQNFIEPSTTVCELPCNKEKNKPKTATLLKTIVCPYRGQYSLRSLFCLPCAFQPVIRRLVAVRRPVRPWCLVCRPRRVPLTQRPVVRHEVLPSTTAQLVLTITVQVSAILVVSYFSLSSDSDDSIVFSWVCSLLGR